MFDKDNEMWSLRGSISESVPIDELEHLETAGLDPHREIWAECGCPTKCQWVSRGCKGGQFTAASGNGTRCEWRL